VIATNAASPMIDLTNSSSVGQVQVIEEELAAIIVEDDDDEAPGSTEEAAGALPFIYDTFSLSDTASRSDLTIKKTAEAPSETSNAQKESMESSTAEDRGEDMPILVEEEPPRPSPARRTSTSPDVNQTTKNWNVAATSEQNSNVGFTTSKHTAKTESEGESDKKSSNDLSSQNQFTQKVQEITSWIESSPELNNLLNTRPGEPVSGKPTSEPPSQSNAPGVSVIKSTLKSAKATLKSAKANQPVRKRSAIEEEITSYIPAKKARIIAVLQQTSTVDVSDVSDDTIHSKQANSNATRKKKSPKFTKPFSFSKFNYKKQISSTDRAYSPANRINKLPSKQSFLTKKSSCYSDIWQVTSDNVTSNKKSSLSEINFSTPSDLRIRELNEDSLVQAESQDSGKTVESSPGDKDGNPVINPKDYNTVVYDIDFNPKQERLESVEPPLPLSLFCDSNDCDNAGDSDNTTNDAHIGDNSEMNAADAFKSVEPPQPSAVIDSGNNDCDNDGDYDRTTGDAHISDNIEMSAVVKDQEIDLADCYVCVVCQPFRLIRSTDLLIEHCSTFPDHETIHPLCYYNQVRVVVQDLVYHREYREKIKRLKEDS